LGKLPSVNAKPRQNLPGFCLSICKHANSDENKTARQGLAGLFALRERDYSFAVLGVAAGAAAAAAAAAGALSVVVVTGAGVAAGPLPL
jgi:hypothetical protein